MIESRLGELAAVGEADAFGEERSGLIAGRLGRGRLGGGLARWSGR